MGLLSGLLTSLLLFTFTAAAAVATDSPTSEIEIMFEDAASPWSNPDGSGYANDLVVAAFREMKISVRKIIVPYSRCKQMALNGKIAACVSMTWLPEFQGLIEISDEPLIVLNVDIFQNKKAPLPKPSKDCLLPKNSLVGRVLGYEYPDKTMDLEKQGVMWQNNHSDTQSLQMLAFGRIKAAVVITNDLEPRNQKAIAANVNRDVEFAFNCGHETGSIGFSLQNPRGTWARDAFQEGFRLIKKNGVLNQIRKRWSQNLANR